MGTYFTSGLLAGVTASVIWISICLMTDLAASTVGLWSLVFLVVGTVGTMLIASVVAGRKGVQRP